MNSRDLYDTYLEQLQQLIHTEAIIDPFFGQYYQIVDSIICDIRSLLSRDLPTLTEYTAIAIAVDYAVMTNKQINIARRHINRLETIYKMGYNLFYENAHMLISHIKRNNQLSDESVRTIPQPA